MSDDALRRLESALVTQVLSNPNYPSVEIVLDAVRAALAVPDQSPTIAHLTKARDNIRGAYDIVRADNERLTAENARLAAANDRAILGNMWLEWGREYYDWIQCALKNSYPGGWSASLEPYLDCLKAMPPLSPKPASKSAPTASSAPTDA